MSKIVKCIVLGSLFAVPTTGRDLPVGASAAERVDVHVTVSHLRSHKGTVIACLTANPEKFPKCRDDARAKRAQIAAAQVGKIVFHDVVPGRYAIALLHDENGNGKADRAISMIPREGFGFSRDAKVSMGPPRFDDAAFRVKDADARMTITMRYML